jgi:hypothetical protein
VLKIPISDVKMRPWYPTQKNLSRILSKADGKTKKWVPVILLSDKIEFVENRKQIYHFTIVESTYREKTKSGKLPL